MLKFTLTNDNSLKGPFICILDLNNCSKMHYHYQFVLLVITGYIREGLQQPRLLQCGWGWYHLPTAEGERRKEEVDKDDGRWYLLPKTEEDRRKKAVDRWWKWYYFLSWAEGERRKKEGISGVRCKLVIEDCTISKEEINCFNWKLLFKESAIDLNCNCKVKEKKMQYMLYK